MKKLETDPNGIGTAESPYPPKPHGLTPSGKPRWDNGRLYAGASMHFYCTGCGEESDVKPEGYTDRPNHLCATCRAQVAARLQTWSDAGMWQLSPIDAELSQLLVGDNSKADVIRQTLGAFRNGNLLMTARELAAHLEQRVR